MYYYWTNWTNLNLYSGISFTPDVVVIVLWLSFWVVIFLHIRYSVYTAMAWTPWEQNAPGEGVIGIQVKDSLTGESYHVTLWEKSLGIFE
jgi:hypothetical protein